MRGKEKKRNRETNPPFPSLLRLPFFWRQNSAGDGRMELFGWGASRSGEGERRPIRSEAARRRRKGRKERNGKEGRREIGSSSSRKREEGKEVLKPLRLPERKRKREDRGEKWKNEVETLSQIVSLPHPTHNRDPKMGVFGGRGRKGGERTSNLVLGGQMSIPTSLLPRKLFQSHLLEEEGKREAHLVIPKCTVGWIPLRRKERKKVCSFLVRFDSHINFPSS